MSIQNNNANIEGRDSANTGGAHAEQERAEA